MSNVRYGIIEGLFSNGEKEEITYGIAAYNVANAESSTVIVASVSDITIDRKRLEALVELCNREKLSPIHLKNVVEDFLAE